MRINKQVIKDYFGSFFTQYKLNKEQFTKVRDIVDNAECSCCKVVTFYWINDSSPAVYQFRFKDATGNILLETSLEGSGPQRICVPKDTTQFCINILSLISGGGNFNVLGSGGLSFTDTETLGETCISLSSFDDVYITFPVAP